MPCSIQLPDGSFKRFPSPPTALELAKSLGEGLAKKTVGVLINKDPKVKDLRSILKDGDFANLVLIPSEKALEVVRHSSAHVLAQAVQNLWPKVKVTIGPVIENGFYYDFDTDHRFSPEDLNRIEEEMKRLIKKKYPLVKETWTAQKAGLYFEKKGEILKKQIIEDLGKSELTVYKQGDWLDLCQGPHVQNLDQIGAIKLLSQSGAYWRGDSKNKQLTRIYGTAFHTEKQLKLFLKNQELAKKNDHRQIGKNLDLFWFSELSPGTPFFTTKGVFLYQKIQAFLREKYKEYDYEEIISPQIFQSQLFKKSGHLNHFSENMYSIGEKSNQEENSFLKPMNCPGHCLFYKRKRWSYKELPWRLADFGRLHRNEPAGSLQGLTRVKSFCQDDAHIFCTVSQLAEEIQTGINMLKDIYQSFGLMDYSIELSTRPKKHMGEEKLWDQSEQALSQALNVLNIPFILNPGDGAFYGPKLDIKIKDSFSRSWQVGTFQCDFNLPKAFDLTYFNKEDKAERPVLIHRAILGSLERFIGLYLEHVRSRLPTWLSPVQVLILPLLEKDSFSLKIKKKLEKKEIVCKIDNRNEKLSYKVRSAQNQQIPYMLIIGKKEQQSECLSVRLRTGELFSNLSLDSFSHQLSNEIKNRSLKSFLLQSHSEGTPY